MAYRVVLVENDEVQLERLAGVVRNADNFELAASFQKVGAALGQSSVFHPNLFLIDVDSNSNLAAIPEFMLAFRNASVIGMMSKWNADIAEQCVKIGIKGCIVKPLRSEELVEAVNVLNMRGKNKPAHIIAFFSPKGRSGKTTIVANLALSLARESGEYVGVIDADLQFGDIPIFFDVDVLSPVTLNPYFIKLTDNLKLLCSPKRPEFAELVEQESLIDIIRMSSNLYRYVLIDLPSGVSPLVMGICEMANTVFLSGMMGSGFEVKHMQHALGMFQGWSDYGKSIKVVFSRVNPCNEQEQKKLSDRLQYPVAEILPNEYLLISVANSGHMLEGIDLDSPITKRFDKMAHDLIAMS